MSESVFPIAQAFQDLVTKALVEFRFFLWVGRGASLDLEKAAGLGQVAARSRNLGECPQSRSEVRFQFNRTPVQPFRLIGTKSARFGKRGVV